MSGMEVFWLCCFLASMVFNVVQMRWWQADRAEIARMRGEREAEARAERETKRTERPAVPSQRRGNDPGPRAHADCTPGQPCLSGRGECPYGEPR